MGDVRVARMTTEGRELVFAFAGADEAVWGWDPITGEQWWYAADLADELRDPIARALATLTSPPTDDPGHVGPPSSIDLGVDLATHRPGHAVLARIATLYEEASTPMKDGLPGSLDDQFVNWCVGFVGEEETAAALAQLPSRWRVLHAVPVGERGSDIDHVLVGPAGVFALNSKRHLGQKVDVKGDATFVAGSYQHYVRNSRLEAQRATVVVQATFPQLEAHPVIVVIGARLRVKESADGVTTLSLDQLVPWLESLPGTLDDAAVDALWEYLRWSSRWTASTPPPAAAPAMAELARRIVAERDLVLAQRAASPRTTRVAHRRTATPRRRASSSSGGSARAKPEGWKIVFLVGVALALVLFNKQIVAGLQSAVGGLAPHITPSATSGPSAASPLIGKPCGTKGTTGKTVTGRVVTCLPSGTAGTLTWRLDK